MKYLAAKSPAASRLRQRKYELVHAHGIPESLVGGSLAKTHRRCGKSNCHCADGCGHPMWSLTSSFRGKRRVERVPETWVAQLEESVLKSQRFLDAVKEVMAINVALLAEARRQEQLRKHNKRVRQLNKSSKNRSAGAKKGSTSGAADRS